MQCVNNDEWYPARQDRPHDISLVIMYSLSNRVSLSGSWVYYTGNATTFPEGKCEIDDKVYYSYKQRNSYRMPDYHRMDIGLTIDTKPYKTGQF